MSYFPQDTSGKILAASQYKDEGNDFFKKGLYKKANVRYFKAIAFTKGMPGRKIGAGSDPMAHMALNQANANQLPLTEEENNQLDELDAQLKANLSASYLKLLDYDSALKYATESLDLRPENAKVVVRKAEAFFGKKFYDKSLEQLEKAKTLTNDISILNRIAQLETINKQEMKKEDQKFAKTFANAFKKLGDS